MVPSFFRSLAGVVNRTQRGYGCWPTSRHQPPPPSVRARHGESVSPSERAERGRSAVAGGGEKELRGRWIEPASPAGPGPETKRRRWTRGVPPRAAQGSARRGPTPACRPGGRQDAVPCAVGTYRWTSAGNVHLFSYQESRLREACAGGSGCPLPRRTLVRETLSFFPFPSRLPPGGVSRNGGGQQPVMILPQVHLRKPCYDFYFL